MIEINNSSNAMRGENQPLVTYEPVELEKQRVEIQDFMEITEHFQKIYAIYLKLMKENQKIITCNQLGLETLKFWTNYVQKSPMRLF